MKASFDSMLDRKNLVDELEREKDMMSLLQSQSLQYEIMNKSKNGIQILHLFFFFPTLAKLRDCYSP